MTVFQVKELNAKAKIEWKEMERRHDLVQNMVGLDIAWNAYCC